MKRWQNYLNVPKYLVEIDGEPLLHRLVRQCREFGLTDIRVATQDDGTLPEPALHTPFDVSFKDHHAGKFLSTTASWSVQSRTFLIFGDAWLSSTCIYAVMTPIENRICFVGRRGPGSYTGCPYGEIFSVSFAPCHHERIIAAAQEIGSDKASVKVAAGWLLYQSLASTLEADKSTLVTFIDIDDFSEDFDYPHDFDTWQAQAKILPFKPMAQDQNSALLKEKKLRKLRKRRNIFIISISLVAFGFAVGQLI